MTVSRLLFVLLMVGNAAAGDDHFRGVVSSAAPEATAAGVEILEAGGNAVDAAIAVSLTLTVTEPAGSGIGGQTVMLVKKAGDHAFVVHGTTWSPRDIPDDVTEDQLRYGHTASTVPSTLRVLDTAYQQFGSGNVEWARLLEPAIGNAETGFVVGPFRHRAFRNYSDGLREQDVATGIFVKPDGSIYQAGDWLKQPLLARTLRRVASNGAMEFYEGDMAREIVEDVRANGGWISLADLNEFPEPKIVPAIRSSYRGFDVETLPAPFGGWVVLRILSLLERSDPANLDDDDSTRRLHLLDALRIAHAERSKRSTGGETTHFSVVDADGTVVSVTQSIDSYFGAKVAHPTLGFLYNNYMQGFHLDDPSSSRYLRESAMPFSSMSATVISRDERPELVLGSPGSARIISSVAQVVSYWIDVASGIEAAVAAFRVHVVPDDDAYVEGPELDAELLGGMAERGLRLIRPKYGVSDSHLDPYFGGVHALALEDGHWVGTADPRRDGTAQEARR